MLLVLQIYSFNNDIRHNSSGNFNLPCGKTDFNLTTYKKLKIFKERTSNKNYEFVCIDILHEKFTIPENSVLYLDPPYFITDAVYNSTSGWNIEKEKNYINFYIK